MKKRAPDLWKHILAASLLVVAAAFWNIRYNRAQALKAETANHPWSDMRTWRTASPEERRAVIASIQSQLDAFRKDNYEQATRYQSAELKANFPTVEAFRRMIKTTYPQFAAYKKVEFGRGRADPEGERVGIRVSLTGQDGETVRVFYMMVREGMEYRVNAVRGGSRPGPPPDRPRRRERERPIPGISV